MRWLLAGMTGLLVVACGEAPSDPVSLDLEISEEDLAFARRIISLCDTALDAGTLEGVARGAGARMESFEGDYDAHAPLADHQAVFPEAPGVRIWTGVAAEGETACFVGSFKTPRIVLAVNQAFLEERRSPSVTAFARQGWLASWWFGIHRWGESGAVAELSGP